MFEYSFLKKAEAKAESKAKAKAKVKVEGEDDKYLKKNIVVLQRRNYFLRIL